MQRTEVEVVVLGIANADQEGENVDDSYTANVNIFNILLLTVGVSGWSYEPRKGSCQSTWPGSGRGDP
jgi:hypothetical protein